MVRYLYKIILITQTTLSCVVHSGKPRYYYHTVLLYYEVNHTYTSQVLICVVFEQIYVIIQHIFDCDEARYHIQGRPFCPKGDVLPHIWGKKPFLCKSIKLKSRFILILSFIWILRWVFCALLPYNINYKPLIGMFVLEERKSIHNCNAHLVE